jgi:Na+-transporting NADH:ubiquinone oxidoreductase subunit C
MQQDKKNSPINVIILAVVLCVVCSLVVSTAAVGLKSLQDKNVTLDRKVNLLQVTGFENLGSAAEINELFDQRFEVEIIDLETGKPAVEEAMQALNEAGKKMESEEETLIKYNQVWASKSKKDPVSDELSKEEDIIQIKYREKFSHVYIMKSESGDIEKYVFPVRGYGLWSMMKGFLAVEPDLQTIAGLTFYEHAETPGLGGEIKSEKFKSQWPGKQIYGDQGDVRVQVVKAAPDDAYSVDALTGATITSKGVSNMMKYWLGEQGFGPYIKQKKGSAAETTMVKTGGRTNG